MAICTQCSNTLPELPGLPPAKLEEVAFELGMSQKIEAIRILREALPAMGLKEAKEYVDCPHGAPGAAPPASSVPVPCPSCGKPLPLPSRGDEVVRELAAGNKIMAIKIVREVTTLGLKEAKDFVECPHATAPAAAPPATTTPTTLGACPTCGKPLVVPGADGPRAAQFAEALQRGAKIEAIKLVREVTGWGLKEAKDFVECPHASPTARVEPSPTSPPPPTSPPALAAVRTDSGVRTATCAILLIIFVVLPLTGIIAIFLVARATAAEQEARYEQSRQQQEQEAKAATERKARLEQERARLAHLEKTSCPNCHVRLPTHATLALDTRLRVVELLRAGKKIEAIKAVRAATNWGLMEAKKYVDCPHETPP